MHYELIDNGKRGRLLSVHAYDTPIIGHNAFIPNVSLFESGRLVMFGGLEWDFGTGAIDTPAVVEASLVHDAFCWLTGAGLIPWECRAIADRHYREMLASRGTGFARRWAHWLAVRGNSKFIAYWQRGKP